MLFRRQTLEGIARGDITLAFRRWKRPTVKAGGRVRTAVGVVGIGSVEQVYENTLRQDDAIASGFPSLAALKEMLEPKDGNPIYRIELSGITADERVSLRESVKLSDADWQTLQARFDRWEKAKPGHFPAILKLISARPEVAAAQLAERLGVEKAALKSDVRKLKEHGLTESLDVGYRLSPRGAAVLKKLGSKS